MPNFNIFNAVFYFLILLFCLSACNVDKHKEVDASAVRFQTTDSSVLFFKNLRQSSYDKEENKVAKADIYRSKDRLQTQNYPVINLAIVHHWRNGTAYIMVEPNEVLNHEIRLTIEWQNPDNQSKGTYLFDFGDMEMQHKFATMLYDSVQKKHLLKVKVDGKWLDLMPSKDEKEIFRKTMLDYLRLVNLVR
jgi:hypothetical protein